jgi:3-oxoacyl-[acyl-carrier-protein] synthase-3
LFALATAAQFVHSGVHKTVLVVGADVMTSILDPKDRNTFVLFGDGAGAVLLEPTLPGEKGVHDFVLRCDGAGGEYLKMPAGGSRNPATHMTVEKRMHFVHQDGRAVFKSAVQGMADVSAEILERNGMTAENISLYVPHQANMRIIDAAVDRLRIDPERVVRNIDRYANTTAATIPIGLSESQMMRKIRPGDTVLLASFGAGFTAGSVLLSWNL